MFDKRESGAHPVSKRREKWLGRLRGCLRQNNKAIEEAEGMPD
jgi:hypothetical protein